MTASTRLIVSILVVAALAVAFWTLALAPKREQASKLGQQAETLKVSLAEAQSTAREAEAAKREFPADYRQLVVLGQAVPAGDETSSLLVELNQIAARTDVTFERIELSSTGESSEALTPAPTSPTPTAPAGDGTTGVPASESIPPTEAEASLLPLGATIGTAGLGVMPYSISFKGDFFQIADLIHELDALVRTSGENIAVDGRLLTIGGFSLAPEADRGFPHLEASFTLTAYVTPPSQGVTAGASPTTPETIAPATEGETTETSESPATGSETAMVR